MCNSFTLSLTGELEEMVYKAAISLIPERQKQIYYTDNPKANTYKNDFKSLTVFGEKMYKDMEVKGDLSLYSSITCEYKSQFQVYEATQKVIMPYFAFDFDVDINNYDSIRLVLNFADSISTDVVSWLSKHITNGAMLSSIKQCEMILA